MKYLKKHWKSLTKLFLAALVLAVTGTEIIGRLLGLCDPVLMIADDRMEYRCAPSQVSRIQGRIIKINAVSMRSDEVDDNRPHILLLGDSVLWGGTVVDQSDLASARVERALGPERVQVLNASAGSWGPPNLAAYVTKFGTFEARTVVLVLSTQDAGDAMTFEPVVGVNSSFPDRKPVSVTLELINRYIPRLLAVIMARSSTSSASSPAVDTSVMNTLRQFVAELAHDGTRVIVVMHPQRDELGSQLENIARTAVAAAAREGGAEFFDARPVYQAHADRGDSLYRDAIHLTTEGQAALAEAILQAIKSTGQPESGRGPTTRAG